MESLHSSTTASPSRREHLPYRSSATRPVPGRRMVAGDLPGIVRRRALGAQPGGHRPGEPRWSSGSPKASAHLYQKRRPGAVATFPGFGGGLASKKVATRIDSMGVCTACHAEGRGFEPRRSRQSFQHLSPPLRPRFDSEPAPRCDSLALCCRHHAAELSRGCAPRRRGAALTKPSVDSPLQERPAVGGVTYLGRQPSEIDGARYFRA
jgi:hypothetical protein